jgi:hypothetical protein
MSDTTLEARLIPIIRRIGVLSEIELARLLRAEQKDVRRVLTGHASVRTVKGTTPQMYEWRE